MHEAFRLQVWLGQTIGSHVMQYHQPFFKACMRGPKFYEYSRLSLHKGAHP